MLTLGPGYARLDLSHDSDFAQVSESLRALLHVCRLNRLAAALVVSRQDAFDWRSSLRIGIRFAASRDAIRGLRLALVAEHFNDGARGDVLAVTKENGLDCRIFRGEEEALAWLAEFKAETKSGTEP
jgi:hypothetical protein